MSAFHILILALVQGLTEFLPVSSSAHLILAPLFFHSPDQGPLIDVAVHVGSLGAVLVYFRQDTKGLFWAGLGGLGITPARRLAVTSGHWRLFWLLILASVPVILAGFVFHKLGLNAVLRSPFLIAIMSIVFGVILGLADRYGQQRPQQIEEASSDPSSGPLAGLLPVFLIGLAQTLALFPGVSRSGITMTAARALGFERAVAARFSMLLSIPVILGAGFLAGLDLIELGDKALLGLALQAAGLSFLAALLSIYLLMRWLARASFLPFVLYRIGLGGLLLVFIGLGYF